MRWRHLIHLLWIPLLLVVLPLAAVYHLAYTESGLQLLAAKLNGRIGPVRLEIVGASGTLARGVHVDRLVIDQRRVHIEIEDASATLAILPLAWQTIRVPHLTAARLLIHALPRTEPSREWKPYFLPPLMRVQAERLDVGAWRLITTSGTELDSSDVHAAGTVFPKTIRLYAGSLTYNDTHLKASGDVLAAQSIGLNGVLHFDAHPGNQPPWTINARIEGNLARLGFDANITEPFAADVRGAMTDLTGAWQWQGHGQVRRLELAAWGVGNALGAMTASLALDGDRDGFHATGMVEAPGLRAGPMSTEFAGSLHGRILTIGSWRVKHAASGASAEAHGSVAIVPGGPRLDLEGSWDQFRWPLAATQAPAHSEHGRYTLQGVRPFAVTADGDLRIGELPDLQIALAGALAGDGLTAQRAEIGAYGGHADVHGALHWSGAEGWQVQGQVSDLDLAQLRPGYNGRLSFTVDAAGKGFRPQSELMASIADLAGSVRGQHAAGHAQIAHRGDDWQLGDVRLQLGGTRIDADGSVGSALDVRFAIEAADLGLLKAGAHGQLRAQGRMRGTLADPTLLLSAKAHDIDWSGARLDALDAKVEFDPHGSGRADSRLELTGLKLAGRALDHLTLRVDGTTAEHSVALSAHGENLTLALHGSGRYAAGAWLERISSVDLSDPSKLHLTLEAPAQLTLDAQHLRLEQSCLHDERAHLCAAGVLEAAQRRLEIHATDLPLRALTAGLTPSTDYDGTLDVHVAATALEHEPWRGTLNGQLSGAAVRKHLPSGQVETLALGTGTVALEITEHELTAQLALDAGAAGHIAGRLAAHGTDDDPGAWPLTGQIALDTQALGFVSAYVPQLDRARGRLGAQLTVSGNARAPQLAGELKVTDGQLDAYQINLSLRDVSFSARLENDSLTIEGGADAGPDGHASVSGSMHWDHGLPYGDLHLVGNDLRIVNIPEARIDASPDVSLHVAGRRIEIAGLVTLPYARIEPANLANAVLPSGDETILGQSSVTTDSQFQVFSHVTLVLGERVTIDTQGLSGRLSGSITVNGDDSGIARGSGELKVEEGKYLAYGRNLDIERGRLLFSNGLIGDPGLDLRAVKKFPDITAGMNVRGTLRAPRMTFFSDPEVSQSQIVSLLLAGGSLESTQNVSDAGAHGNAGRADALAQGGAILAQQLGGRFDIEAGVEQDLTNETSLVLGRYLSPRLYVSYGVGLAEAINTVKMRYTIGDHWTIKTEAGTQRSADLVFTIEK